METSKYFKPMIDFIDKCIEEVEEIAFETFLVDSNKLRYKKENLLELLKK